MVVGYFFVMSHKMTGHAAPMRKKNVRAVGGRSVETPFASLDNAEYYEGTQAQETVRTIVHLPSRELELWADDAPLGEG